MKFVKLFTVACAFLFAAGLILSARPAAHQAQSTYVGQGVSIGSANTWSASQTFTANGSNPAIALNTASGASGDAFDQYNSGHILQSELSNGGLLYAQKVETQVHFVQPSANGDYAGTLSLSSATSASHTFGTAYGSAPTCTITPTSNLGTVSWWVTTSTTAVTANVSSSSTVTFNYLCFGNPS